MKLLELYDPTSYGHVRSHSEMDLIINHVRRLGLAWVSVNEDNGTAVLSFEIENEPGKIVVRAKPGIGGRPGKKTLFTRQEVLRKRAKAAAIAQKGGHIPQDFEEVRETLLAGVGNNVIKRFLNTEAFDIVSVNFNPK